jgi:hypothetical protein
MATVTSPTSSLVKGNRRLVDEIASARGGGGLCSLAAKRTVSRSFSGTASLVVVLILVAFTSRGGVIFDAGDATAPQGYPVIVPITVSGFSGVTTFQFTLSWDFGVLGYSSVGNFGLAGLDGGNFGYSAANPNWLTVSWDDPAGLGVSASDGTVVFAVTFTAIGNVGQYSAVDFTDDPTLREVTVSFQPVGFGQVPGRVDITAVPEPVNLALGCFGCLLVATATVRWLRIKRQGHALSR